MLVINTLDAQMLTKSSHAVGTLDKATCKEIFLASETACLPELK
jgi:hypothetical protein